MSYTYEGVLKVVRRSRATLLFSVGVPMVKPRGGGGPSPSMFMGIIVPMCLINMSGF